VFALSSSMLSVFLCVRLFKRWCNPRQDWCLCVGWPMLLSVSVFSSSPVFFCVFPLFICVRSRFSPSFFFSLFSVLLFPFLALCPVFSVQDEDNGGKSTRCCWLMDQNFPLVLFLSVLPLSNQPLAFFSCFFPSSVSWVFSAFSLVFLSSLFRWFGVCSWRRIIRLTNACSFPALHLRFENKGKAGLLSICSLPISLFLGPLFVFVHAPYWPLGSALSSSPPVGSPSLVFITRECHAVAWILMQ